MSESQSCSSVFVDASRTNSGTRAELSQNFICPRVFLRKCTRTGTHGMRFERVPSGWSLSEGLCRDAAWSAGLVFPVPTPLPTKGRRAESRGRGPRRRQVDRGRRSRLARPPLPVRSAGSADFLPWIYWLGSQDQHGLICGSLQSVKASSARLKGNPDPPGSLPPYSCASSECPSFSSIRSIVASRSLR
jgi:hypothetical protein